MSTDPNLPNSRVRVSSSSETMEQESSSVWDLGNLLDFSLIDDADPLILPWDLLSPPPFAPPPTPESAPAPDAAGSESSSSKVRKRDPRLVCENFLAGRVPCACPEVDELMLREEAEAAAGGRKRVRVGAKDGAAAAAAAVVRCQVSRCEVDIRELKGYPRRHQVCLRCANAQSVAIDREDRWYCQQCGRKLFLDKESHNYST